MEAQVLDQTMRRAQDDGAGHLHECTACIKKLHIGFGDHPLALLPDLAIAATKVTGAIDRYGQLREARRAISRDRPVGNPQVQKRGSGVKPGPSRKWPGVKQILEPQDRDSN